MGVEDAGRFVAFWLEDNQLFWGDGERHGTGNSRPWKLWRWRMGTEILKDYCFGCDEREPDHHLVLDRRSRNLYALPAQWSQEILLKQFAYRGKQLPVKTQLDGVVDFSDHDSTMTAERMDAGMKELKRWIHNQATWDVDDSREGGHHGD